MKKNFKKVIAYSVTMLMVLSSLPAAYASGETASSVSTVTTTYDSTAASEVDASGKWKYRNLAPGEGEESSTPDAAGYVCYRNDSGYVSINKDTENKVDGNYSWKADLGAVQRVNVFLDTSIQLNKEYYLSTWIKQDYSAQDYLTMSIYTKYKLQGDEAATEKIMPRADESGRSSFEIAKDDWVHYQNKFKLTASDDGKTEDTSYKSPLGIMNITNTSTRVNVNLDDLSFRLIPADDECIAYTKSASTQTTPKIATTDEISFTFSNDIDMYTVTPQSVLLNGTAYDSTQIRSTVNEETRETTVYIKFNALRTEQSYSVELSGIKDAWGRDIVGTNKTDFETLPAIKQTAITFADKDNQPLTSLAPGKVTTSVTLKSNIGNVNANIIAAECDGNRIVEIQYLPVTITASEVCYTLPALDIDSTDNAVRVYVWSDSEYPTPYTRYGIFSKNGYSAAQY